MSEIIGTWKGSGGSGMEWRDIFLLIKRIKRHKKNSKNYEPICLHVLVLIGFTSI
jgi:hypothetical protein